jgi:hypothetical protein
MGRYKIIGCDTDLISKLKVNESVEMDVSKIKSIRSMVPLICKKLMGACGEKRKYTVKKVKIATHILVTREL